MQIEINASYPRLFALEVAEAFLEEFPHDPAGQESVKQVALMVGHHLAALGKAGEWQYLQVRSFLQELCCDENELIEASLTLIGIFGWLGNLGALPPASCKVVLRELRDHGSQQSYVRSLAESGISMLDKCHGEFVN